METYFTAIAAALMALVLFLVLKDHGRHMMVLLSIAAVSVILIAAIEYLKPITELIKTLSNISRIDQAYIRVILKAVGVGLIGEMGVLVCNDGGNSALARGVEMMTTAAVLWLSVPLITAVLELIQQITGEL